MDPRRDEIIGLNIERFERLLAGETDPPRRETLETLLAEARNDALVAQSDCCVGDGEDLDMLRHEALCWQMRAEQYRTVALRCHSDAARVTYLYLARGYEVLAHQAEKEARRRMTRRRHTG